MSRLRLWTRYIILPFFVVILVDQLTKFWAETALVESTVLGPIQLRVLYNTGFFLGGFKDSSRLLTVILPVALGGFLVYAQFVIQYFLPIASIPLRAGLAILFGALISNVIDRFRYGAVVDFILLRVGNIQTGIFNLADALQWVGIGLFFYAFFVERNVLYPPEDRRGRMWIDSAFQGKYCLSLIFVGLSFALISGSLSYTFLSIILERTALSTQDSANILSTFSLVYVLVCAFFFTSLFLIGVRLSHRIVGPVKSFSRFLDDLINGKNSQFKLRERDEFLHFEELASRFQTLFHDRLGMVKPGLEPGMKAPYFSGTTYQGEKIGVEYFEGKKTWLIFYRYATCPLCALHLNKIRSLIELAQTREVKVAIVYENSKDTFIKSDKETGGIGELLTSMKIPLISDPQKKLYQLYRTKKSFWGLFSVKAVQKFFEAKSQGYRQGTIDGQLTQLPAHFFIGFDGKLMDSYYGQSIADHPAMDRIEKFINS